MYKLLALDLDGTLLRRDGRVDERDQRAVSALQARGVAVTIVTGRLFAGTRSLAEQLGIVAPLACADGAQLVDPSTGRELEHTGIAGEAAELVRACLRRRAAAVFLLFGEGVLHDARGAPFVRFIRSWSPTIEQADELYEQPCWRSERGISGVVAVGPDEEVAGAAAQLRQSGQLELFDFRVSRVAANQHEHEQDPPIRALLAHAAGVSKGSALVRLAERCGCSPHEVVAVGDWLNDVEMFTAAGRSFVMAHAPEPVRQAASDQLRADARSGGGVAEAIAAAWPDE